MGPKVVFYMFCLTLFFLNDLCFALQYVMLMVQYA